MILSALLLALAAPQKRPTPPTSDWMVGVWVEQDPGERDLGKCASWLPVSYQEDGSYSQWEVDGRWTLKGDQLTETPTAFTEAVEPDKETLGRPIVSRIVRVGPDELKRIDPGSGKAFTMLRCPKPETPVAR
jgi:hypothetical protein